MLLLCIIADIRLRSKNIAANENNARGSRWREATNCSQQKTWVIARDKTPELAPATEEIKFVQENAAGEEVLESVEESGRVDEGQSLIKTGVAFRPFTPPFAQLQSEPVRIASDAAKLGGAKGLTAEGGEEEVEFCERICEEPETGGKVELVYDPVMKCYYDPRSGAYYQLEAKAAAK